MERNVTFILYHGSTQFYDVLRMCIICDVYCLSILTTDHFIPFESKMQMVLFIHISAWIPVILSRLVAIRASNEGLMKVHEDFRITEIGT